MPVNGVPAKRAEFPVTVRCGCGGAFELSPRPLRSHRQQRTTPRCSGCRYPRRVTPAMLATPALRRWWLDRLGYDRALELSRTIWPAAQR